MGKTLFLCDGEVPTCKKSSCYKNAERKQIKLEVEAMRRKGCGVA